jgi:hypothetical protein
MTFPPEALQRENKKKGNRVDHPDQTQPVARLTRELAPQVPERRFVLTLASCLPRAWRVYAKD